MRELRAAYSLAYHQRYGELRAGRRTKTFDDRGIHPYSEVWGRISVFLAHAEGHWMVEQFLEVTPYQLTRMAEQDAHEQVVLDLKEEA